MTTQHLSISDLAKRCQAETERFKQTRQSNEIYCLELFHRALLQQDENAWAAIYCQYQPLVASWVYQYSRFTQTGEPADFFVNEAFARLWQSGGQPDKTTHFDGVASCLKYLKLCVGTSIEDYLRHQQKDALVLSVALEDYDRPELAADNALEHTMLLAELMQLLDETLQDERDHLVAEESWQYHLAPRQIQSRHPDIFVTADEISQIKRNILKRLKRNPRLTQMNKAWTKNV